MDTKEIRELIELISRSSFSAFELERDGFKIKLVKQAGEAPVVVAAAAPVPQPVAAAPVVEAAPAAAAAPSDNGLVDMHSPIVGTFYRSPRPESPSFVEVGSKVRKGQVLCIVEAMKVMNEIESEIDAEVAEVLVSSGQPVEYHEVLFRLRPV